MSAPVMAGGFPSLGIVMPLAEQRGGAELALLHFLCGLEPECRAQVNVCFLEDGPMRARVIELGYSCSVIASGRLRRPLDMWRTWRALHRWIQQKQLRVVLSWMTKAHLYAGPAAAAAGVPSIWWQHGLPTRRGLDQLATLLPARGMLACSHAAARAQSRLLGNRHRPRIVHPPVDLAGLRSHMPGPTRQDLGVPDTALVVGIVARLQKWKGVHLLIEAAARLMKSDARLHLLVVGGPHALEPEYPQELAGLCARLGLRDRVTFAGQRSDAVQCMALMDVAVNASFGEPFGMVIVEAMAMGLPVVAPRAAGPLEIISDGTDGILFEPGDVDALAAAIAQLLQDPARRRLLGANARIRARDFDLPTFVARVSGAIVEAAA